MKNITEIIASITPAQQDSAVEALARQAQLTKPAGSLGKLETIALQMAGITGQVCPQLQKKAVVVMAADHGITTEGVSAFPSDVTKQMVHNFLQGGAAINALARQAGAEVVVVDIGVAGEIKHPNLITRKVAPGTANMLHSPAMTAEQVQQAISTGIEIVDQLAESGVDLIATGEMGIGNTTAASAITASLLNKEVAAVTGRGTGLDDAQLAHKVAIIEQVLQQRQPERSQPLDVLAKVGGLEIGGLVGVILGAAARHIPVIIDGFISGSAALIAYHLNPIVRDYLFAGHISVEKGHRYILDALGLSPVLDLQLRLGEGTGAVLAMHIIEGALRTHAEMATFAEAGVSGRDEFDSEEIEPEEFIEE